MLSIHYAFVTSFIIALLMEMTTFTKSGRQNHAPLKDLHIFNPWKQIMSPYMPSKI